jgi:hypothetical protein
MVRLGRHSRRRALDACAKELAKKPAVLYGVCTGENP